MDEFNELLIGERLEPKGWVLHKSLKFSTQKLKEDELKLLLEIGIDVSQTGKFSVRTGFQSRMKSIPKGVWAVVSVEDIARAAVLHDYFYHVLREYESSDRFVQSKWKKAREVCDKVFLLALEATEPPVASWKQKAIYKIIRSAGSKHAKKAKQKGD